MSLNIEQKSPPKVLRSVRISPKAAAILDELAEVYDTSQALCVEGLLNAFGPGSIEEAKSIKKNGKTHKR